MRKSQKVRGALAVPVDAVQELETADEQGGTTIETLWAEYRSTRSEELRNRLVLHYSPLVKFVAGRLRAKLPASIDQDDLLSDGVIGLIGAVQRFEPDRGLQFDTFAVPRIRGAILDGLRSLDWVPRSVRDKLRDAKLAQAELEAQLNRTPDDADVAAEIGVSVRDLRSLYAKAAPASVADIEEFTMVDELAPLPLEAIEDEQTRGTLIAAVKHLPERDQIIIALYYFEGLTLSEIGQVLQLTESRISQLNTQAARRLRAQLMAIEASHGGTSEPRPGTSAQAAPPRTARPAVSPSGLHGNRSSTGVPRDARRAYVDPAPATVGQLCEGEPG